MGYPQSMVGRKLSVKCVASPENLWWNYCTLKHWSGTRHKLMTIHGSEGHDMVKQGSGADKVTVVVTNLVSCLLSVCFENLVERIATLLVSIHWRGRVVYLPVVSTLLTCYVTVRSRPSCSTL